MIIIRRDNNEDIGKDENRNRDKSYIKKLQKKYSCYVNKMKNR